MSAAGALLALFAGAAGGCSVDPILATDLSACATGQACSPVGSGSGGTTPGAGGTLVVGGVGGGSVSGTGGGLPGGDGSGGTLAGAGGGSGGAPVEACTDIQLPDHQNEPCSQWAEWGQCNEPYVLDYCDLSCGRCTPGTGSGSGGASSGSGGGGGLGDDNPWGNVTGGQNGWASRYWDCCKQSCGWAANAGGNPVDSCNTSGESVVDPDTQSTCSSGSSTTCNSFAPWANSTKVAFGFAATHAGSQAGCGTCFQLQFTGSSHNGGNDPGSQALKDKVMIVMATNIGGDVSGDGQLDVLIPGGGTGAFYGCGQAWGVQQGSSELGAQYGGLRSGCSGDLNAIKSCVANKCQSLFGSRGLDDMYEGCMWYVDWFEAADNPNFTQKQIDCPNELRQVSGR